MGEPTEDRGAIRREAIILAAATVLLAVHYYRGRAPWLGPRLEIYGWFALTFALLFVAPVLLIRLALREPVANFGLTLGKPRVWGRDLGIAALVLVPIAALATRLPGAHSHYLPYREIAQDPLSLLPLTLGWGLYFFAWELFFRGFLMTGLRPRLGRLAILIQLLPFVMAHFGKPELEVYASIPGGLCLAWIAWRGESFLGAWLLHWLVATTMNLCFVFWT